jgi:hypothetical protein
MNLIDFVREARKVNRVLESNGCSQAAQARESLLNELESTVKQWDEERLNLSQASKYSRYSVRQLRRLLDTGELRDYGRPHAPLIRRGDLPIKCVTPMEERTNYAGGSRDQIARLVVDSRN